MITANSRVTALDILEELGVANAADKIKNVRVRIGGVAGINKPEHLIAIQPEVTHLDVLVGTDFYELELAEGNAENNADVKTFSARAMTALKAKGDKSTEQAKQIQKIKAVARKIAEAEEKGEEFVAKGDDIEVIDEAREKVALDKKAREEVAKKKPNREVTKVKSK
jgi:hypothetical protein